MQTKTNNNNNLIKKVSTDLNNADTYHVASAYNLSIGTSKGKSTPVECPMHGGSPKDGKAFIIGNRIKCFKCAADKKSFSNVDIALLKTSKSNYVATLCEAIEAINLYGTDTQSVIESLKPSNYKKNSSFMEQIKSIQMNTSLKAEEYVPKPIASDSIVNTVLNEYTNAYKILGTQKLSKVHYAYLKERRLTHEDILKGGYFTIIQKSSLSKLLPIFLKKLREQFNISEDDIAKVPGFYKDINGNITVKAPYAIGIPIINAKGLLKGIQLRLDKPIVTSEGKELRYLWLSSDEIPEGCTGGVGPGAQVDVTFPDGPKNTWNKTLFITEGKFKAQQLSKKTNAVVISVQGVGNWAYVIEAISDILEITNNNISKVCICYDADIAFKTQVNAHAKNLCDSIAENYPKLPVSYMIWDANNGKGIDDLIFNNAVQTIKVIPKDIYTNLYNILMKNITDMGYNFDKLPDTIKQKIFIDCIYNRV